MHSAALGALFEQFSLTSIASWTLLVTSIVGVIVALILGASAVTLAATGWQILFQRRPQDLEKQVDLSIFNPTAYLNTGQSHTSGSDDLGSCLFAILLGLVGGLFWLGIQLGQAIAKRGLPSSTRKNPNRPGRVALSFIYILTVFACLLGLFFGLQAITAALASETKVRQMPTPSSVPLEEAPQHLNALWAQLDQGSGITWSAIYSPLFPSEWPPTPKTIWTRYAFAYGREFPNPTLADAERVSRPWARLELHPSPTGHTATIVPLQSKLEAWEIQGVQPLDQEAFETLKKEALVSDYCLRLTTLPDPDASETAAMRAFYRTWLKYNGAIASEISPHHTNFIAWLGP
jgi:hypothetical protein